MDKSPCYCQQCSIHIFLSFLGSLLRKYILFEIFLQFSLPPCYTKLKLRKNSFQNRFVGGYRNFTCHASIWNFNIYTLAVFVLEIFNTRFAALTIVSILLHLLMHKYLVLSTKYFVDISLFILT